MIESRVSKGLRRFGISISYVNSGDKNRKMYENVLRGAISVRKPLNIIQVGANDGKYNDPIYDFVKENMNYTNIILIEPITDIIPYLKENYSYHPSVEILNKAISNQDSSSIKLYGLKKRYWDNVDAGYGKEWPNYRIPTGVITTNKNQLSQWISKNVRSESPPESMMEKFDVDIVDPDSIINRSQVLDNVHLLQVDTEGMDDEVVYSFLEADIFPNIINIETEHLSQERLDDYDKILKRYDYDIYNYTLNEKLALK